MSLCEGTIYILCQWCVMMSYVLNRVCQKLHGATVLISKLLELRLNM